MNAQSRRGFSLVELLVAMAIIAIFIGLLIPAVQRVREAASRTRCMNNMKQIALAVHEYENDHKHLPMAGTGYGWCEVITHDIFDENTKFLPDPHIVNQSGLSLLLPYLGEGPLDAQLDRKKAFSLAISPYDGDWPIAPGLGNPNGFNPVQNGSAFTAADVDLVNNGNLAIMGQQLAIFRCPSDTGRPFVTADKAAPTPFNSPFTPIFGVGGDYTGAKTSYDFVTKADPERALCNCWPSLETNRQYMFGQNSNCPIARVSDGMSNTFMIAETCFEVHGGSGPAWGYRSWGMPGVDPYIGINVWTFGEFGNLQAVGYPGSMHPGGCHFAMGDGSVRWVSQTINLQALAHLSTIAGGVPADTESGPI